jgi:hypothetical protein
LIHILSNFDQDKRVVVRGYEGGFDDINHIKELTIYPVKEEHSWYGRYDNFDSYGLKTDQPIEAIYLHV